MQRMSDNRASERAKPSRGFVLLILPALLAGCAEPVQPPSPVLSTAQRRLLRSAQSFGDLFEEVGRVRLQGQQEVPLSVRPLLKAVTRRGEFVVLDKLNVRIVPVFGADGRLRTRIGSEGREPGEYIYPHTLAYDPAAESFYIYDGDLLRVCQYAEDFQFQRLFQLPLVIDQLLPTTQGRLYAYYSSQTASEGRSDTVYEIDTDGNTLNSFAPQSRLYNKIATSEGGGIVQINGYVYAITPYEFQIRVYNLDGRFAADKQYAPAWYRSPGTPPDLDQVVDRPKAIEDYHRSWSHIRQIIDIDDRAFAVVAASPGEREAFLDVFDLDLSPLTEVKLPPYLGEIYVLGDRLYLMAVDRQIAENGLMLNPEIVSYRLRTSPSGQNLSREERPDEGKAPARSARPGTQR